MERDRNPAVIADFCIGGIRQEMEWDIWAVWPLA
jgi:hypothetical protein